VGTHLLRQPAAAWECIRKTGSATGVEFSSVFPGGPGLGRSPCGVALAKKASKGLKRGTGFARPPSAMRN